MNVDFVAENMESGMAFDTDESDPLGVPNMEARAQNLIFPVADNYLKKHF